MSRGAPTEAPYGTWASPISSAVAARASLRPSGPRPSGDAVFWSESRPEQSGRATVLRRGPGGEVREAIPAPYDARTGVHEYGGAAWQVVGDAVVFSHFADGRLHRTRPEAGPVALTPASGGALRYADLRVDADRARVVCVREDHRPPDREPVASLVAVSLNAEGDDEGTVLAAGADFYSGPTPGPDGDRLAWIEWDHPNMPWDGTRLMAARIEGDGRLGPARLVAGGPDEAVQQPVWTPEGHLIFVSDRSGWWNLHRDRDPLGGDAEVEALHPREAEFGVPAWAFGLSTVTLAGSRTLVCTFAGRLARLDLGDGSFHEIATPYRRVADLRAGPEGRHVVFVGGSPTLPDEIARLDLASDAVTTLHAPESGIEAGYLSEPRTIEFRSEGGRTAYAHHYPPANRDHVAPPGERPPLLVKAHGGPTSAARLSFDPSLQYWTSRGFAVVDVDYGGSTGHGRAYRERLNGSWGVVDVEDCRAAAERLVDDGEADRARLCIHGRSAGGFTALHALSTDDRFAAGGSHFGVADLVAMVAHTHKFESRYFETLVGPWPEARARYDARSPIRVADRIERPVIFFQGDRDAVVPPDQTERMVAALRANGVPVAYRLFEGEGHGFRDAASIRASLDDEFSFYAQILGFEPADDLVPVRVERG